MDPSGFAGIGHIANVIAVERAQPEPVGLWSSVQFGPRVAA